MKTLDKRERMQSGDDLAAGGIRSRALSLTALAVLLTASLFHKYVYLQDFPNWVYQGVLFRDWLSGNPSPNYLIKPYPVPYMFGTVFMGGLDLIAPWKIVAKIFIVFNAALAYFAITFFARSLKRYNDTAIFIAVVSIIFGLLYNYGNSNYEIGVWICMIFAGYFVRDDLPPARVAIFLVIAFFCHGLAFLFCSYLAAILLFQRRRPVDFAAFVPGGILGALYIWGRYIKWSNVEAIYIPQTVPYGGFYFVLFKGNTLLKLAGFVNFSLEMGRSIFPDSVIALGLITSVVFIYLFASQLFSYCKNLFSSTDEKSKEHQLAISLLAWSTIFVLAPQNMLGIADIGQRLVSIVYPMLLIMSFARGRAGRMMAACSVLFCVCTAYGMLSMPYGQLPEQASRLPSIIARFATVLPWSQTSWYQALATGRRDRDIFPSGMFVMRTPGGA